MTSRKKISAINKLAKKWECAVYLKTGVPPGIMIAESEGEEGVGEWVASVKVRIGIFIVLCDDVVFFVYVQLGYEISDVIVARG